MEFITLGLKNQMGSVDLKFLPSQQSGLKFNHRFDSGITEAGSGVSQWDDASGNGYHLKQGTDTNRPSKESDGSILFNGSDNNMRADAFTFEQPEELYILVNLKSWTEFRFIFDGEALNSGRIQQVTATPELAIYAGGSVIGNVSLTLNTFGILRVVFDGANSLIQLNNGTPVTGNAGTNDMGGFVLGSQANNAAFGHIQVKETIAYDSARSADQVAQIYNYLSLVGGLSI